MSCIWYLSSLQSASLQVLLSGRKKLDFFCFGLFHPEEQLAGIGSLHKNKQLSLLSPQNNLISREMERKLPAPRLRKWEANLKFFPQVRMWKGLIIFQHYLRCSRKQQMERKTGKRQANSKNRSNSQTYQTCWRKCNKAKKKSNQWKKWFKRTPLQHKQ